MLYVDRVYSPKIKTKLKINLKNLILYRIEQYIKYINKYLSLNNIFTIYLIRVVFLGLLSCSFC